MPAFDFDAAARHGADRQTFTDHLMRRLYDDAERLSKGSSTDAILIELHIAFLDALKWKTPVNAKRTILTEGSASEIREVVEKTLGKVSEFTSAVPERKLIILKISTELFATASCRITSDFSMWESEKFTNQL